jgi:hypothetical protein
MKERHEKRKRWVRRGRCAVEVEKDASQEPSQARGWSLVCRPGECHCLGGGTIRGSPLTGFSPISNPKSQSAVESSRGAEFLVVVKARGNREEFREFSQRRLDP